MIKTTTSDSKLMYKELAVFLDLLTHHCRMPMNGMSGLQPLEPYGNQHCIRNFKRSTAGNCIGINRE